MLNSLTGKSSLVSQFECRTSHSACSLSPSTLSLALCHHSPYPVSLTVFDQSPLPEPWCFRRTLTVPAAVDYRFFYGWLEHDGQQRALNQSISHKVYWTKAPSKEVPSTVKCRRRKCVLLRGGLDPNITQFIDAIGFIGLFKVPDMEVYTQFS
ncbi:hypothetical protein CMV_000581 [Castanea mollissima]|uniref:Uncharacterized protein n=1 Tax=Castanea mollissima TaxID=60419 RepID=A0A8J4RZ58_9ROSI|nr:hypothetical protein CMV_000581 [Castanea mollissima]